jgi:hypothetical protein
LPHHPPEQLEQHLRWEKAKNINHKKYTIALKALKDQMPGERKKEYTGFSPFFRERVDRWPAKGGLQIENCK